MNAIVMEGCRIRLGDKPYQSLLKHKNIGWSKELPLPAHYQ